MAPVVLCAGMAIAFAAAGAASGMAMDAPIGAQMTLPPLSAAPIEAPTRRAPPVPEAGPLRPADPARLERVAPVAPRLPPAEPITPARDLAQLRRAAEPRSGFGSTRAAADAAWTLGLLHLHGGWVDPSPALAQTWFQRATLRGRQPLADAGLAWCLIDGCQGPPDPAGARRAIERLRARNPARASYLEWVLNTRLRPGAADAEAIAAAHAALPMAPLLRRAVAAGDAQARLELGIDAVRRGDLRAARQYFQGAASRSPAAAANLRWVSQHSTWPGPAREDGEVGQILARARQFHRGDGVPANYAEAMRLYRLAAARGSAEARRMVALIASRSGLAGSVDIGWMAQLAQLDTRTSLPQLDTRQVGSLLQRDATPLYDLVPAHWQRRMNAARPA
ncbi:MAG: hypothetical protein EOO24_23345 [Comamonadaceae bacterium]|nr:MAG: hypothetical protein EOO24_23345 [Comamonadaceae bacterium]